MSEKNNPAIGPDDGSVASVGEVEGDRGIPQVGRKKPVTRIWWIMGVGVLIVCLVALAAVAGLNKVKNRNKGAEPEKANVTTNVPELSASAFATDEPPPLPEGTAPAQPAPSSAPGAPAAQGEPKLTPEQQKVIMNASKVAAKYNRDLDAKMEKEWLAELKKQGMQIVEKPDIKAFREAVKPVYEKYEPQFGKDLIQAILNTK